jgi:hypothetical protein
MEWLPELLDLVVRVFQISVGLTLPYGAYLVAFQMSAPPASAGMTPKADPLEDVYQTASENLA